MGAASAIRYGIDHDSSKFHIPHETLPALAYAVLVSSSLCYGLISWCNRQVSPTVVTSFWPLQVGVFGGDLYASCLGVRECGMLLFSS
jgi:hypothetical protein